ncbi:MAG: short chain dehydrogenase [Idiomarinaceae bacterium]|uniref:Short chain dehydrogenase n=1 Tax=Pseudidiomarina aquimaris TaxID=641841 RepID=A0A432XFC3_9GAMM|nr:SDR family oxidoreductase [Pseudidiomarina aquimaris]MBG23179.1 short chain dehydrogenase [Idiomarinaceae bacterium]RUO47346.1 short chain dehydrogenase [Pseudidiomarina aquimaris]|tara:strand:+ start:389 stop:1186 length:798 start_codon:yes stop_codon:yes gene_type:complete
MQQQRIVITGGASGLGFALAQLAAKAGWKVAILDRDTERGEAVIGSLQRWQPDTRFFTCDVTRISDLENVAKELDEQWQGIDILVNNAGVAQVGKLSDTSISDWQWIIDINLLGVVRGCKAFLPLLQRNGGHIINVASMAGLLDVPNMTSYNATKAAVVSLSETLENELAEDKIHVTAVCPSFFKTNLGQGMRSSIDGMEAKLDKLMSKSKLNATDIAKAIMRAIERQHSYTIPHKQGRYAWYLKRFLPRSWYRRILYRSIKKHS